MHNNQLFVMKKNRIKLHIICNINRKELKGIPSNLLLLPLYHIPYYCLMVSRIKIGINKLHKLNQVTIVSLSCESFPMSIYLNILLY